MRDDGGPDDPPGDPDADKTPFCGELGKLAEPRGSAVADLDEGAVTQVLELPEGYSVFQLGESRRASRLP